ncbi:MarR family winged helix-turn-helix transcriptional regulator [Aquimixticola soesokkakensis]|nr:MarR family winged helix-turn-helix transcriptional regulator [Aquimixticola soesokkakensis]
MSHIPDPIDHKTGGAQNADPQAVVRDQLLELGFDAGSAAALMDFDVAYFQWFRIVQRGEIFPLLAAKTGIELELAAFQGLIAILRIKCGIARPKPMEPTIGLVAEELAIDPSRASRIVSDLVSKGLVARVPSQNDGRKSILSLSDAGSAALDKFRAIKWRFVGGLFEDWEPQDIATFSRLFRKYASNVSAAVGDPQ